MTKSMLKIKLEEISFFENDPDEWGGIESLYMATILIKAVEDLYKKRDPFTLEFEVRDNIELFAFSANSPVYLCTYVDYIFRKYSLHIECEYIIGNPKPFSSHEHRCQIEITSYINRLGKYPNKKLLRSLAKEVSSKIDDFILVELPKKIREDLKIEKC